ncbi:hypothetical protein Tco_0378110 [Tanacetum coccineum]
MEGTPARGTYSLLSGVLGGDTCEGYIFITARVFLEGTPVMGTYGFHYYPSVLGGDTSDGRITYVVTSPHIAILIGLAALLPGDLEWDISSSLKEHPFHGRQRNKMWYHVPLPKQNTGPWPPRLPEANAFNDTLTDITTQIVHEMFKYFSLPRTRTDSLCWLTTAMEKDIRSSVKYANTTSEIWLDLLERFGKESAPRAYELKQTLSNTHQSGNLSLGLLHKAAWPLG